VSDSLCFRSMVVEWRGWRGWGRRRGCGGLTRERNEERVRFLGREKLSQSWGGRSHVLLQVRAAFGGEEIIHCMYFLGGIFVWK
jgi:hypothetical protein